MAARGSRCWLIAEGKMHFISLACKLFIGHLVRQFITRPKLVQWSNNQNPQPIRLLHCRSNNGFKYETGHCPEWSRMITLKRFSGSFMVYVSERTCLHIKDYVSFSCNSIGLCCMDLTMSRPRADIVPVPPSRSVNKIYVSIKFDWIIYLCFFVAIVK